MQKLLVATPVKHIGGLIEKLEKSFSVDCFEDASYNEICSIIHKYDAIYINPNKARFLVDSNLLNKATSLKVISTASTGLSHIDVDYAKGKGIEVLSLTRDYDVISRISSTAELAFALTLSLLRNIPMASKSVLFGHWNYMPYIGRQMNEMMVGVIGFGRLGKMYASYCSALGAKVLICDINLVSNSQYEQTDLHQLISRSDIIALHVHLTKENKNLISSKEFELMKEDSILINTSRGEIIDEEELIKKLSSHSTFKYGADVISDEISYKQSKLIDFFRLHPDQVLITPHIGGMTREAQRIAFHHSADKLINYFIGA